MRRSGRASNEGRRLVDGDVLFKDTNPGNESIQAALTCPIGNGTSLISLHFMSQSRRGVHVFASMLCFELENIVWSSKSCSACGQSQNHLDPFAPLQSAVCGTVGCGLCVPSEPTCWLMRHGRGT